MSEPSVCCVMLTNRSLSWQDRAARFFNAQNYKSKFLHSFRVGQDDSESFGTLRNQAVTSALGFWPSDIIIHWDDDDWSHPNRIATQVRQLQDSGADCVGLRKGMFWDSTKGEAWLYRHPSPNYCLDASLCYWRRAWEARPFPAIGSGAGEQWAQSVRSVGYGQRDDPMMIFEVHGANHGCKIVPGAKEWRRAPEWDDYCRSKLT